MGIRMNKDEGYNRIVMQLHWNNPSKASDQYDSSGVKLYFEKKRREFDGGLFILGQQYLELKPKLANIDVDTVCAKNCTKTIMTANLAKPRSLFFTGGFIHMHDYGQRGYASLYRNGALNYELIPNETYSYNTPKNFVFPKPVEYKIGDEIKMNCNYNTQKSKDTIYFGESTQDEMCYAFFEYYPANSGYSFCMGFGEFSCETILGKYALPSNHDILNLPGYSYGYTQNDLGHGFNCSVVTFLQNYHKKWQSQLESACDVKEVQACRARCKQMYEEVVKHEPCFSGLPLKFITNQYRLLSQGSSVLKSTFEKIQLLVAPCRAEAYLKSMMVTKPKPAEPTATATARPITEMMETPLFIGIAVALAVIILVLFITSVWLCAHRNQAHEKSFDSLEYETGGVMNKNYIQENNQIS